jgi:chemotaxis protein CheX
VSRKKADAKQEAETLRLPPILDLKAAAPLRAQLLELKGKPVVLDGTDVQRLGGLCLQVLLSARDTWSHDGMPFSLTAASEALEQTFSLFGVQAEEFQSLGV